MVEVRRGVKKRHIKIDHDGGEATQPLGQFDFVIL